MTDKPNCYDCKFIKPIPGHCHKSCDHPCYQAVMDDPISGLLTHLAPRVGPIALDGEGMIKVVGHPTGIKNGWFSHPFNFDPTWLISCDGFEAREEVKQ